MTATATKSGATVNLDWDELAQMRGILLHYKVYMERDITQRGYDSQGLIRMARAIDRNDQWIEQLNKL